ncbi:MAG: type II toxin-antitoxin system death-on-curing family toxin [Spirochaetales bacterium]|nr:type II toxin-antitoxin system death-on-curing family toxin [Spirochaetales bacterium]
MEPIFLTVDELLLIHKIQIEEFGGVHGLRDSALLESAMMQPMATIDGIYLHPSLFDQAAAYVFHLCQNHPFLDGNKRAALAGGLVFLEINGIEILDPSGSLYEMVMKVARGVYGKKETAEILRGLSR